MACEKCKKKKSITESEIVDVINTNDKGIIIFTIIWSAFAIFGLYNFVSFLVNLIR